MKSLREYRNKSRGFPDELIWNMEPADGVIKNKDGSLMAAWYFRGEDLGSATHAQMATISARLNQAFCLLGSGWMMHCDAIRRLSSGYPPRGAFTDRTTLIIDEERRLLYNQSGKHYETIYAITLTFLPDVIIAQKVTDFLYENHKRTKEESREKGVLEKFNQQIEDFEKVLSGVFTIGVRRIKCYKELDRLGKERIYDELLEYLEFCLTGSRRRVRLPSCPMNLDALIGNYEIYNGDELLLDGRLIKVVAIDGLPQESFPGILHALDELSYEYRWSTRFQFLEPYEARNIIAKERKAWRQKIRGLKDQIFNTSKGGVDLDAVEMAANTDVASSEAESGLVRFGFYTSVIVLSGEQHQQIRDAANEFVKTLRNIGYGARIETINTLEAFLGSLPGHGYQNIRKPVLHTLNLADMLPITSVWAGSEHNPNPLYPPKSAPLLYASTVGSTIFRMSLHVSDLGHALLLSPPGSGKTSLINLCIAQHFRYPNARVFGFDRKYGSYILTKAAGGSHYDLAGENSLRLCVLNDIDSPSDRLWAGEYIETLLILQGLSISSAQRNTIGKTILQLSSKPKGERSLTEFNAELQDKDLREALQYYTLDGAAGHIFDGTQDTLQDSDFMMFEMEALSNLGEKILVPALLYLFRQMEKRLDGRPTFVPLDESWLMLRHPLFKEKVEEWLRTWRSKNAHVLLASQHPSDVVNSSIAEAVLASCPTKILPANKEARDSAKKMYEVLGCNEKEIELISSATPKRDYYYKSPLGRRMFSIDLGAVGLSFAAATSTEDVIAARALIEKHGDLWPAEWLRNRGLPDWADYWLNVR